MYRNIFLILAVFVLGALTAIAIIAYNGRDDQAGQLPRTAKLPAASPFVPVAESGDMRIQQLEEQIAMLNSRIGELESAVAAVGTDAGSDDETQPVEPAPEAASTRARAGLPGRMLSVEGLVRAGIDEVIAEDILRRRNEVELARLELRDRASREGYLGTRRYRRELAALNTSDISLRDEIGDAAYDRYLFATGQNNRVRVASVMMGSTAEQAGIEDGDVILSYNGNNVFQWSEIQQATTGGELGEYVSLGILRDGIQLNLWVPRGPLGVRLAATRLDPESQVY